MSSRATAVHVLERVAYGPRAADLRWVEQSGPEAYIERQLRPRSIDDSVLEASLGELPSLQMSIGELYREYPPPQLARRLMRTDEEPDEAMQRETARRSRIPLQELTAGRILRAVESRRQLNEVLIDFWFNHFNVFAGKGQVRYLLSSYERDTIRPHVLGRFRDLLGAVARSPAMLVYLDNWQSAAEEGREVAGPPPRRRDDAVEDAIRRMRVSGRQAARMQALRRSSARRERPPGLNENYARELLELHTLGADGGYGQDDVGDVARALTGWTLSLGARRAEAAPGFYFRPDWHDAEEKVVVGTALPAGRGLEDGEDVLDLLAAHPSTATTVATKLCRRFIADAPPRGRVEAVAAVFRRTDGDLRATTAAVLLSDEFLGDDFHRAKVKSPLQFLVSAARALDAPVGTRGGLARVLARLGAPLYGASAPTGYPETAAEWTSANAILARMDVGLLLARQVFDGQARPVDDAPGGGARRRPDDPDWRPTGDLEARADAIMHRLLPGGVGDVTRKRILGWAREQEVEPGDAELAGLVLGSPEFQRC